MDEPLSKDSLTFPRTGVPEELQKNFKKGGAARVPLVVRLLQPANCLADQQAAVEAHPIAALLPGSRL